MTKEIWKSIPGYEGLYEVSNLGRVKSLKKIVTYTRTEKIIPPTKTNQGYLKVGFKDKKLYQVHRLVLAAFKGMDLDYTYEICGCHKNDIRDDNRLDNLFIGTHKDNAQDSIQKGRDARGEKTGGSKLKNKDIPVIRQMLRDGYKQYEIAASYGVDQSLISKINTGGYWNGF